MTSIGAGWAQLRQQTRSLETQTEALFHTYSQHASMTNIPPKPSEEEERTHSQLRDILERRSALLTQLSRLLDSDPTPSALKSTNLSRHREILSQHTAELSRLTSSISLARDRANLLSSVRSDIDAYRTRSANPHSNPEAMEADYMLDERRRVDNSNSMADSVLAQAYAVNENFGLQRESLANIQRRIVGAASQVPGINGLIHRISAKKRRDGIILGSFMAFCFLMFFWFM
ncbi:protein transport protein gos1 [Elasticomyces elasticus]|nr:protein transport protein gos1 [Elasticomyces elasticus]